MKKKIKKAVAVILTAMMTMSVGVPAFAAEEMNLTEEFTNAELARIQKHNQFKECVENNSANVIYMNEFEYYNNSLNRTLDNTDITLQQQLIAETLRRASLSIEELLALGYDKEKITQLKKLENKQDISVREASAVAPDIAVYSTTSAYEYNGVTDKTCFIVEYDWYWAEAPLTGAHTDIVGFGWADEDWALQTVYNPISNYNYIQYTDLTGNSVATVKNKIIETDIANAKDLIEPRQLSRASSGFGAVELHHTGVAYNAEFSFKYGHNTTALIPTISLPFGVGFNFANVQYPYAAKLIFETTPDGI